MRKSPKINYRFNKDTLQYEILKERSVLSRSLIHAAVCVFSSLLLFLSLSYLFSDVLELKDPKTKVIERNWREWQSRLAVVQVKYDHLSDRLDEMERRDNNLYRSIFGMDQIPDDVREAGYGGVDRYSDLRISDFTGNVTRLVMSSDILLKKAYIQSRSFDHIAGISQKVGEMAICVPNIPPVDYSDVFRSSGFGMRVDPITKNRVRHHDGVDFAPRNGKMGMPVYATGKAVVSKVGFSARGYGHFVQLDHGFGYKTMYAHLLKATVHEGQEVQLGQQVGEMGNSGGRSTGTHLHYEVIYMNRAVNPVNYYSTDILPEDYAAIVEKANGKAI